MRAVSAGDSGVSRNCHRLTVSLLKCVLKYSYDFHSSVDYDLALFPLAVALTPLLVAGLESLYFSTNLCKNNIGLLEISI